MRSLQGPDWNSKGGAAVSLAKALAKAAAIGMRIGTPLAGRPVSVTIGGTRDYDPDSDAITPIGGQALNFEAIFYRERVKGGKPTNNSAAKLLVQSAVLPTGFKFQPTDRLTIGADIYAVKDADNAVDTVWILDIVNA